MVKKETLFYDIHGLVKFSIQKEEKFHLLKDLNDPISYFLTGQINNNQDIEINIGEFEPSNLGSYIIDHRYHIKENYFYYNDGKVQFEIFGFENGFKKINYCYKGHKKDFLFPDKIFYDLILIPIIELILLEKNHFLMHGAGVSKNGIGLLFAGRPGSYKSSLTIDFVRKEDGFKWLGDDRVIIGEGRLLSFPTSPITFDYKSQYLKNENFSGILDKLRFIKYLRKHQNDKNKKSIENESNFTNLIFLQRTNKNIVKKIKVQPYKAINMLINNNQAELMSLDYYKYLLAYSFVLPNNTLIKLCNRKIDILKENLNSKSSFIIEIPQFYDSDVYNQVRELI